MSVGTQHPLHTDLVKTRSWEVTPKPTLWKVKLKDTSHSYPLEQGLSFLVVGTQLALQGISVTHKGSRAARSSTDWSRTSPAAVHSYCTFNFSQTACLPVKREEPEFPQMDSKSSFYGWLVWGHLNPVWLHCLYMINSNSSDTELTMVAKDSNPNTGKAKGEESLQLWG